MYYTNTTNTLVAVSKEPTLLRTELGLLHDVGGRIIRLFAQNDRIFAPMIMT